MTENVTPFRGSPELVRSALVTLHGKLKTIPGSHHEIVKTMIASILVSVEAALRGETGSPNLTVATMACKALDDQLMILQGDRDLQRREVARLTETNVSLLADIAKLKTAGNSELQELQMRFDEYQRMMNETLKRLGEREKILTETVKQLSETRDTISRSMSALLIDSANVAKVSNVTNEISAQLKRVAEQATQGFEKHQKLRNPAIERSILDVIRRELAGIEQDMTVLKKFEVRLNEAIFEQEEALKHARHKSDAIQEKALREHGEALKEVVEQFLRLKQPLQEQQNEYQRMLEYSDKLREYETKLLPTRRLPSLPTIPPLPTKSPQMQTAPATSEPAPPPPVTQVIALPPATPPQTPVETPKETKLVAITDVPQQRARLIAKANEYHMTPQALLIYLLHSALFRKHSGSRAWSPDAIRRAAIRHGVFEAFGWDEQSFSANDMEAAIKFLKERQFVKYGRRIPAEFISMEKVTAPLDLIPDEIRDTFVRLIK